MTGDNAVGKTNVVEAIYYLSLAKSFRANDENELIQKGKDKMKKIIPIAIKSTAPIRPIQDKSKMNIS